MKQILKDAFKSSELQYSLEEVIAVDDKIPVSAIPDATIIKEAKYVLGKFTGASVGFEQEADYKGNNGPEQKSWAIKEVAALKKLLEKYDDEGVRRPPKKAIVLVPGLVVYYNNTAYKLLAPAGPRKGWTVTRESDNEKFRMKCKQLTLVRLEPATKA